MRQWRIPVPACRVRGAVALTLPYPALRRVRVGRVRRPLERGDNGILTLAAGTICKGGTRTLTVPVAVP